MKHLAAIIAATLVVACDGHKSDPSPQPATVSPTPAPSRGPTPTPLPIVSPTPVPTAGPEPTLTPEPMPTPTPSPSLPPTPQPLGPCEAGEPGYALTDTRMDNDEDGHGQQEITKICLGPDKAAELKKLFRIIAKAADVIDPCDYNRDLLEPRLVHWDRDHDGYATEKFETSCAVPTVDQIEASKAKGEDACDDVPQKFKWITAHPDGDKDGFGTAENKNICVGVAGLKDEALDGSVVDDAPERIIDECDRIEKKYHIVHALKDGDKDTYGVGLAFDVCIGAEGEKDSNLDGNVLVDRNSGEDACDDIPFKFKMLTGFRDKDKDQWSVGPGQMICVGKLGTDDEAFQGFILQNARKGEDCDDGNGNLKAYTLVWKDGDGDGIGAGPVQRLCTAQTGKELRDQKWSFFGYDQDDGNPNVIDDPARLEQFLMLSDLGDD